jgi:hypothetical protein
MWPMPKLSEVLRLANWSRDDFNNARRRGYLTSKIESSQGEPTELTVSAALEIYFFAGLKSSGIESGEASMLARKWVAQHSRGKLSRYWAANPRGHAWRVRGVRGIDLDEEVSLSEIEHDADFADFVTDEEGDWSMNPSSEKTIAPATHLIQIDRSTLIDRIKKLAL